MILPMKGNILTDLTFIDLFAGIGGGRIGFETTGARCVFSSEWDKFAQKTYASNFGEVPEGDITQIRSADIPNHDILLAGFPCQPFSLAGVSKLKSLGRKDGFMNPEQGNLFFEVARILKDHQPEAFFLENVKNLQSHDGGNTFEVIRETLAVLGYHFDWRVIDASKLVPQHRERIYIVGFKDPEAYERFDWPSIKNPRIAPKISDILENEVDGRYTLSDKLWNYLVQYAEKHRAKGNGFGYGMPDMNGIARTLSARYHKDGSEILIKKPRQKKNPRRLTPRECARLMGFPENFVIPVSDTQAYRQFGNSVVVPVIHQIALQMIFALTEDMPRNRLRNWKPSAQIPMRV